MKAINEYLINKSTKEKQDPFRFWRENGFEFIKYGSYGMDNSYLMYSEKYSMMLPLKCSKLFKIGRITINNAKFPCIMVKKATLVKDMKTEVLSFDTFFYNHLEVETMPNEQTVYNEIKINKKDPVIQETEEMVKSFTDVLKDAFLRKTKIKVDNYGI